MSIGDRSEGMGKPSEELFGELTVPMEYRYLLKLLLGQLLGGGGVDAVDLLG